jgi:CRISPR-associated endoribonuclease Cas6
MEFPKNYMKFRFLAPTSFKQGPDCLLLPLPKNVFYHPLRVWNSFAPKMIHIAPDWLDWCTKNVFVEEHQIKTSVALINRKSQFKGFIGNVTFHARSQENDNLIIWQALGRLATFSGIGRKTTMGMGVVEIQ